MTNDIYLADVWYDRYVHPPGDLRLSTATKTKTAKTTPDDFAGILRSALKASDQTLYRVSMETKIGQDVLSRFVREERGLSLETAGRLAVHLGYALKRS